MTLYISNRDGNGKTSEEGHYRLPSIITTGNALFPGLAVTQNSPLSLSILVAAGDYRIDSGLGYAYHGWNNTSTAVALSTADSASPRIDSIVIYVDKGAATSASPPNNPGIAKLIKVNGTPAASPTAPSAGTIQTAVGAGNPYIVLADVRVNALATTVTDANITDRRSRLRIADGVVTNTSLLDGAVTTNKITDGSVTASKLATNAVQTINIINSNVTTAKIADNAVTAAKMEAPSPWIYPVFQNGWTQHDNTWAQPGYYKDSIGIVHLRGLVRSGTAGSTIFTVPPGYRIGWPSHGVTASSGGYAEYNIFTDGRVTHRGSHTGWFSLDHITWRADQ